MKTELLINELKKNKTVFSGLLSDIPEELITWRQSPDKWCLLEIVCHLYDEEREDFRSRVKNTLENPETLNNTIDPQGWVTSREYMEKDYGTMLKMFLEERDNSIEWLLGLKDPKWTNELNHPKRGPISAKKFFVNWLAHDYLHIRQILKLKYDYLKFSTGETLDYAGDW
ncbi:MAG: DinB family protein [Ignavibacteria bacterium]|nr:DinB family protein [Ignavibacteria bacterium]